MAGKIRFDLVSPEKLLYSAEADMVTVPGREGDFAVLAGHEPFISIIRTGLINVKGGDDGDMRIFVRGGFAEVNAEGLIVLAEEAMPADDLDAAALDARIKDAEEDLADAKDDAARAKAAEALEGLRQMRIHA
ncbi:MAG TPA: F0F1 ATP synthase subunit epsilon [Micropepsaceae bacterium]|nr:F0F1 ATP synthase subunit epsilon [Micropepsaceae bacterium]HRK71137.1 F0F1 ATP synthase subunit epsilon [Micropepsaceae bacterium]